MFLEDEMKTEEKDKINRVIAEAMGLHCTFPDITDKFWYKKDGYFCSQTFNSVDSISDAMEAVKALKIPLKIWISSEAEGSVYVRIPGTEIGVGETDWNLSAAVSLALEKYIKEGK